MNTYKQTILDAICYTDLVYERINKKLNLQLSRPEIENMIRKILLESKEIDFQKKGKNIYIRNESANIQLTINSYTNRIITVNQINKKN